ncbi:MAG: hypothetical protein KDA45_05185 [Planctomycetales bacterium]|nr:hypothetical protein [Planctomycetales bacterium]
MLGIFLLLALQVFLSGNRVWADELAQLARQVQPWLPLVTGQSPQFTLEGTIAAEIDDRPQPIRFQLVRFDEESFDLAVEHAEYAVRIRRRAAGIAFCVPLHQRVFLGRGRLPTDSEDHLRPVAILDRLVSPGTRFRLAAQVLKTASPEDLAGALISLIRPHYSADRQAWLLDENSWLRFGEQPQEIRGQVGGASLEVRYSPQAAAPLAFDDWPEMQVQELPREEIEVQLARGTRRALEIVAPSALLTSPQQRERRVEHGRLQWIDGQRVVLLHGTPQQIGQAHGQLLAVESARCIDSVLYAFGTVQTIVTGRWFRSDLETAYASLARHIPPRHIAETRALATSLQYDPHLVETLNVFPELFHCSGFALWGQATVDGKLYHGRVLDYMTTIGLQDAATTFIVAAEGQIPFANVGYAGFTGSVSGMNSAQISLGEMGGRGEGQWDGVPMATLMRRALEECSSLEEVQQLWRDNPRTCEYFYVFADGQQRTAVGVAATPQAVQFIAPGESHPLLGEGIDDAVVLSAGSRLEELRRRVQAGYGHFDVDSAQALMSRPVAMDSNLHNVLFVPEDGLLYVANATHRQPAAERPYARIDLLALLQALPLPMPASPAGIPAAQPVGLPAALPAPSPAAIPTAADLSLHATFPARDSLAIGTESLEDARRCLETLAWEPEAFSVELEEPREKQGDWLVRFPTARPSLNAVNDRVAMEWYQARDAEGQPRYAPAAVIVHESGSGMTVGRLIAKALRSKGIHTFMLQLPYYGVRRGEGHRPQGEALLDALCQGIADARRARDAVAALPLVDTSRIVLQGTSLGGFVTATTAGLDGGYRQVFVLLAGGDLYGVLQEGKQDAQKVRQAMLSGEVSDAQFRIMLNRVEPLRLAHRVDPQRMWLYSGRYDDVVPPKNSALLAQAAGLEDSHHIQMLANHFSGIIFLPLITEQISQLIQK